MKDSFAFWHLFFPADAIERVLVLPNGEPLSHHLGDQAGVVCFGAPPAASQLRGDGFDFVQSFLALPSPADARWLIPVDNAAKLASRTLPGGFRLVSRLRRIALLAVLRLRPSLLASRTVTIALRMRPALLTALDELFPDEALQVTLSAGTPGPMSKPTFACFDGAGRPLAYAKVAVSSLTEKLVSNEAALLRYIEERPRLQGVAPRLLAEAVIDGRTTVVQSALRGRRPAASLDLAHARFLDRLEGDELEPVARSPFVMQLSRRIHESGQAEELNDALLAAVRALQHVSLFPALMHGDFAPWNLCLADEEISAFDWEYGVIDGLYGLDELHHVWSTSLLLEHRDAASALLALDARARSLPLGLDETQSKGLVTLYLLHGIVFRLELGCDEDDLLLHSYRRALGLRLPNRQAVTA